MTRTFIALEKNEALQQFLAEIIHELSQALPGVRWVDPHGIHLTLAFLGEINDEQLEEAFHAAEEAAQKATSFEYRIKGLGIFGSPRQPRVIWMGVEDLQSGKVQGSPLQLVHRVLANELEMRGFEVEKRPFSPHFTLARIKQPLTPDEQQRLQRLLHSRLAGSSSAIYPVNTLCVMKSELSRTGAKYTCLKEVKFR
ncbi:MAG TPA: RNA 2',3'-cyclic phosphodiesterase [Ktedonobacteraceae bacterium]|nr:RNA 2',3'-cyclic phosphodiesterase [Ktedonobacteraceae bacterium]